MPSHRSPLSQIVRPYFPCLSYLLPPQSPQDARQVAYRSRLNAHALPDPVSPHHVEGRKLYFSM